MRLLPLFSFALAFCVAGCTVQPASEALVDAFHLFRRGGGENANTLRLNPAFQYLRVQVDQREIFMALGYVDQYQDGPVEVWYSALGEVLRLRDGRLIGATMNMGTDWLSVSFKHLPRWGQIGEQAVFERGRDVSPGYQYGIKEQVFIKPIPQPNNTHLQSISAASLTWFEERTQGQAGLPPVRYGVNMAGAVPQVIYAEQCLSADFCFSWQRWTQTKASRH
jgi:hypothetical protein